MKSWQCVTILSSVVKSNLNFFFHQQFTNLQYAFVECSTIDYTFIIMMHHDHHEFNVIFCYSIQVFAWMFIESEEKRFCRNFFIIFSLFKPFFHFYPFFAIDLNDDSINLSLNQRKHLFVIDSNSFFSTFPFFHFSLWNGKKKFNSKSIERLVFNVIRK